MDDDEMINKNNIDNLNDDSDPGFLTKNINSHNLIIKINNNSNNNSKLIYLRNNGSIKKG